MIGDYTHLLEVMPDATDWDKLCYDRLIKFLNRAPLDNEILNMRTDTNLQLWVLTGQ